MAELLTRQQMVCTLPISLIISLLSNKGSATYSRESRNTYSLIFSLSFSFSPLTHTDILDGREGGNWMTVWLIFALQDTVLCSVSLTADCQPVCSQNNVWLIWLLSNKVLCQCVTRQLGLLWGRANTRTEKWKHMRAMNALIVGYIQTCLQADTPRNYSGKYTQWPMYSYSQAWTHTQTDRQVGSADRDIIRNADLTYFKSPV